MAIAHLQKELERLKKSILTLGALVEERVHKISKIIETRDTYDAERIVKTDHEIDEMEVDIEEECLKVLALHQPVAVDLRFIVAVIKINNDLERIGDQTKNIAQRVLVLAKQNDANGFHYDYSPMTSKVKSMVRLSLDSFVKLDTDLALKVCRMDDEVDRYKSEIYDLVKDAIRKNPNRVGYFINFLLISRHLERIGDHSTNIAEEVIYLTEGEIVRHGRF